jgi:hypothetical protein
LLGIIASHVTGLAEPSATADTDPYLDKLFDRL